MAKRILMGLVVLAACLSQCTPSAQPEYRSGMVIWLPSAEWDGSVLGNSCSCTIDDSLEQLAGAYGVELWVYGAPGTESLANALAPNHPWVQNRNIQFVTPTVEFFDGNGSSIASIPLGLVLKLQKICHQLLPLLGESGIT